MPQRSLKLFPQLMAILALAVMALAAWAAWLGWDQHRDVQPDGSETGPYEAWQVIGLVLTLMAPVYWAASRRYIAGAALGVPVGLTGAAYYDWSDDYSGLFMVGVGMIAVGSLVATSVASAMIAFVKSSPTPSRQRP
ncbi:hypothetical protein ACFYPA_14610 [Streptomyces sp. NPDC005775]|uniref:hypothetical protein n=1 Tax=Streptomyces sp. NPDC005775 TaxID=3364729 RepID=UPI0036B3D912